MEYRNTELQTAKKEINEKVVKVTTKPRFYCKMFEDNSAALEIARVPKMRPRTRHINVVYHHFRQEVANGKIQISFIGTRHQRADYLTKQPSVEDFVRHRKSTMGW